MYAILDMSLMMTKNTQRHKYAKQVFKILNIHIANFLALEFRTLFKMHSSDPFSEIMGRTSNRYCLWESDIG